MKRILSMFLVFALAFGWSAVAFAAPTFINIGSGGAGGTYYPLGAAIANIWTKEVPNVRASNQATGASAHNIRLIANGDVETGLMDGIYYFAYHGMPPYEGNPHPFLRGLVALYPEPFHLTPAAGSGIQSFKDLKGKRVVLGAVGSGGEFTSRLMFKEILGLDPDKDIRPQLLNMSEAASALADKNIDAVMYMGAIGSAAITEVTTMGTGYIVPWEDDVIEGLNKLMPYYTRFILPANTYARHPEDLQIMAAWTILAIHEKVDDDTVYAMTKALFDNKQELVNVTAVMRAFDPSNVSEIIIPLHPGAERYYREIGVIK